jgi:carboxynorspermidine decarboxylase
MDNRRFEEIILKLGDQLPSPCFLTFEKAIEENLQILDKVQKDAKCKILLALKAYSMFATFPQLREHLAGICASGLYEAKLGFEEFQKEVHVYSPAYTDNEFDQLLEIADYIVLNSYTQYHHFASRIENTRKKIHYGFRINPEYSEVETLIYNPCVPGSRFGILAKDMGKLPSKIDGLHFHALCQQNSDSLKNVLSHVEAKFEKWIQQVKWVNFGGGHHQN